MIILHFHLTAVQIWIISCTSHHKILTTTDILVGGGWQQWQWWQRLMLTMMMMRVITQSQRRQWWWWWWWWEQWPTTLDSTIQIPCSLLHMWRIILKNYDNVAHMDFQLLTTDKQTDFAYEQAKDLLEVCFDQHISSCCCRYHLQ